MIILITWKMAKCCIENDIFSPKMRLLWYFYDTFMILLGIFYEKSHCRQLLIYQLDITVLNIKNDTLIHFYKKINYTYVRARTIIVKRKNASIIYRGEPNLFISLLSNRRGLFLCRPVPRRGRWFFVCKPWKARCIG